MKKAIVTMVGAALLVAGCGGGGEPTSAVEPTSEAPTSPGAQGSGAQGSGAQGSGAQGSGAQGSGAQGQDVPEALRFKGETLAGEPFDGAALAGKPAVFWFWAPWCPKCQSEGPNVAKAAEKYGDEVSFVGIGGLEKDKNRLRGFVSRTGTGNLTHLDDRTGRLYSHFEVTSQSSFLFMAPDGKTSKDSGPLDENELSRHVDELLG
ncbi:redoxin domain-containing protein [Actinomadura sp. 7K534]|uniref:redoxin domain-containing protein n=1 Tax=Actinomadura sp. 7K534 TaxID=2530366 RepID=UPI001051DEBB|nr:redoxin domain-containing protein [Actinomadura sp. 7K534]TDB94391.1 redoxin domain-containing protein [Actinomadura sp. 7K534]